MPLFPWLIYMVEKHFYGIPIEYMKKNIDQKKVIGAILPVMAKHYIYSLYTGFYHEKADSGLNGYINKIRGIIEFYLKYGNDELYDIAKKTISKIQSSSDTKRSKELLEKSGYSLENIAYIIKDMKSQGIQDNIKLFQGYNTELMKRIGIVESNLTKFIADMEINSRSNMAKNILLEADNIRNILNDLKKKREAIKERD